MANPLVPSSSAANMYKHYTLGLFICGLQLGAWCLSPFDPHFLELSS